MEYSIPFCFHRLALNFCLQKVRSSVGYSWCGRQLRFAGLRVDGRRPPELRRLQCKLGVFQQADGSAFLEQGNTKVLAAVYGPHDVRKSK